MSNHTQRGLSEPRRQFVRLMQWLLFGRITNLPVRGGEPVLDPWPRCVREYKLGGENGRHPKYWTDDFLLKEQHVDLFRQFDAIGDGMISVLEVKHGLPFRMELSEPAGPAAG